MSNVRVQTEAAHWPSTTGTTPPMSVQEDGTSLPARTVLNFGSGIVATDNPVDSRIDIAVAPGGPATSLLALTDVDPAGVGPRAHVRWNSQTSKLVFQPAGRARIREFGAVGDGVFVTNAQITAGSNVLNSATANFQASDVGKVVFVYGAGTGSPVTALGARIATFVSLTSVILDANAGTTVSGAGMAFGTDNQSAINTAIGALAARGGEVEFEALAYLTSGAHIVPGGVALVGQGFDYNTVTSFPGRGTAIIAAGSAPMTYVIQVGDLAADAASGGTGSSYDSGHTAAAIRRLTVWGSNVATDTVRVIGGRWMIDNCQVSFGNSQAVNVTSGQNGYLQRSVIHQNSRGWGVVNAGNDNHFFCNQIRNYRTGGYRDTGGNAEFKWNLVFNQPADDFSSGPMVQIEGIGAIVDDNTLGGTNLRNYDVIVKATSVAAACRSVSIRNNHFYRTVATDTSYGVIKLDVSLNALEQIQIHGNKAYGARAANRGYSAFARVLGNNQILGWSMTANNGRDVFGLYVSDNAQAPAVASGNLCTYDTGTGVADHPQTNLP